MKKLIVLVLALLICVAFSACDLDDIMSGDLSLEMEVSDKNDDSSQDSNSESLEESMEETVTLGQKNALASAKSYLDFAAFSYSGLIKQLEFEGYTTEEATYAVDNCGADWYEQAVKSAESYLEFTSFSKQGLIEQLEYEGFTHEQAVYGVEENGY